MATLIVVTLGCTDNGPIESLRAMPEARIFYPNSKIVLEVATPQVDSPDGRSGATFGHLVGANATGDEIVAFYDAELRTRGWRPADPGTGTGRQVAAWTNGVATFRLGISRPEDLTADLRAALKGYSIEYDARVIQIYPPHE